MKVLTQEEESNLLRARQYGKLKHTNRYAGRPYIHHLEDVWMIAVLYDLPIQIQMACFLHDLLEDTNVSYQQLVKEFNIEIADMVYDVTDELGRNRAERKAKMYPKLKKNHKALLLKICDRIANIEFSINHHSWSKLRMYVEENNQFQLHTFPSEQSPFFRANASLFSHYCNSILNAKNMLYEHDSKLLRIKKS